MDPEKFQRARRYCSNMLSYGLFDWRGEEYQLRHLPQEDQATATSIPDDDSVMVDNHMRNDTTSDRGRSFNNGTGLNNYTSNTFNHNLFMTESNKEHTNRGSTHNNPCTLTMVEKNRIESDEEVGETMEEDEDELTVPVSTLFELLYSCEKSQYASSNSLLHEHSPSIWPTVKRHGSFWPPTRTKSPRQKKALTPTFIWNDQLNSTKTIRH